MLTIVLGIAQSLDRVMQIEYYYKLNKGPLEQLPNIQRSAFSLLLCLANFILISLRRDYFAVTHLGYLPFIKYDT